MRVTKTKLAENRERLLAEAARLFREQGLAGVGVDALAEAAGMTHGSVYSLFGSKDRLAAEALDYARSGNAARMGGAGSLNDYIAHYLSAEHRQGRGDGCEIAALGGEVPRQGAAIRQRFTAAVRAAAARIGGWLPQRRGDDDQALAIVSTMVGALMLARAVDDPDLSDRILAAARASLAPQHVGDTTRQNDIGEAGHD